MKIIKRNGVEVDFDINKIIIAISKANNTVEEKSRLTQDEIHHIADCVNSRCLELNHEINVEDIQDMVEEELIKSGCSPRIAKNYITYRYTHQMHREASNLDQKILSLVDLTNEEIKQENSNKNSTINSTQRDYIAGEVSKDISMRLLLDPDIVEAHNKGIIHFHDADYFIQHMHNCFSGDTKFYTLDGLKQFSDFKDGDKVQVVCMDGVYREATVHNYEEQYMNRVTFTSNDGDSHVVTCTYDHRWYLYGGGVTTNLHVGDTLLPLHGYEHKLWKVESIHLCGTGKMQTWCVEEPITHSFTLEKNILTGNCDLVNLEDMFQNGTVISGTKIDTPHSFGTACNIATQVIAQVASSQFGF